MASLPRDETAFFGRDAEIAEIEKRFAAGARLVTIVGLGGVGKTRLAVATAEGSGNSSSSSSSAKNALYVALGEARSLEAAVRAIAHAARVNLKAESQAKEALATLASALTKKATTLLILDNTEQLGEAARELATGLLDGAKSLKILATAREPIGARGEEKLVLSPLGEEHAILLLRDRARQAAGSAVEVSDEDARAIVRRVDALPLAIELAASRLEVLSPAELLKRLATQSHRTMRATLDWSWDLLSPSERSVLAQASVFAAPFGIDAAEEVIVDAKDGDEVLDTLESLVKRSLLVRVPGADGRAYARLTMFETVRSWAREKIDQTDVKDRHARYHLAEAERAASRAYGDTAVAALDRLEVLLPELLIAFEATKESAPDVAVRIVLALSDLLLFRVMLDTRSELFDRGVEVAARANDDRLLARTLVAKARVTLELGRMQDAEKELRRALDLSKKSGDQVTEAEATRSLGWALTALGRGDEAKEALESAQKMHREQGSARGLADAHVALGIMNALQGNPSVGLSHLREALAIHVENGDVIRQEKVLGFGGLVGHDAREVARGLPREVLARAPKSSMDVLPSHVAELVKGESEAHQRWQLAIDSYKQGTLAHERGDADAAITAFDQALLALDRAGVKSGVAAIQAHAAVVFAQAGDLAEASARLDRAKKAEAKESLVVSVFAAAMDVIGDPASARKSAREIYDRATRGEVGTPELAIATRVLGRLLEETTADEGRASLAPMSPASSALVVGKEARWIIPPLGERIDLVRYGPVRRLLDRLVVARLEEPGLALSAEALIEAGWPGERMRHTAGLLRVYSAVRRLRRLGLEPILITRDDGYLLDQNANIRRDDS